jgi:hypothetical protein
MKFYLFLITFILIVTNIYSDAGSFIEFPETGNISPTTNNNIQMLNEVIIYSNNLFNIIYQFTNYSSVTQNVLCGFPIKGKFNGPKWERSYSMLSQYSNNISKVLDLYLKFKFYEEKTKINYKFKKVTNKDYDYLYLMNVNFPPHKTITISNNYFQEMDNNESEGATFVFIHQNITYILKTGSLWKDTIKLCDIYFYLPDDYYNNGYGIYRNGLYYPSINALPTNNQTLFLIDQGTNLIKRIEWHFTNIKPNFDINVTWKNNQFAFTKDYEIPLDDSTFKNKDELKSFIYYGNKNINDYTVKHMLSWGFSPKDQIRFLINSMYALKDYKFKNNIHWRNLFEKYSWYNPTNEQPLFNFYEESILSNLVKFNKMLTN